MLDTNLLYIRNKIAPRNKSCDIGMSSGLIRNIYASNLKVKTIEGVSSDTAVESINTAKLTVNGKKALLAPEQLYIKAGISEEIGGDTWETI